MISRDQTSCVMDMFVNGGRLTCSCLFIEHVSVESWTIQTQNLEITNPAHRNEFILFSDLQLAGGNVNKVKPGAHEISINTIKNIHTEKIISLTRSEKPHYVIN